MVAAELVDGAGEALGDLSLLGQMDLLAAGLDLPPGEVGAKQQGPASEGLEQRASGVVLELALFPLEVDPVPCRW